jgi:hypothetical protein
MIVILGFVGFIALFLFIVAPWPVKIFMLVVLAITVLIVVGARHRRTR